MKEKQCPHCGAPLPQYASFCPVCAREAAPRRELVTPAVKPRRRKLLWLLLPVLAAAVLCAALLWTTGKASALDAQIPETPTQEVQIPNTPAQLSEEPVEAKPQVFEGGAVLDYPAEDGTLYTVGLYNCYMFDGQFQADESDLSVNLARSESTGTFYHLVVGDEDAAQAFYELVETADVQIEAVGDSPVFARKDSPLIEHKEPYCVFCCHLLLEAAAGENEIVFTLHMKNGDTILLRRSFSCTLLDMLVMDYRVGEQLPTTMEDLQALLTELEQRENPVKVILYLPPADYEGDLVVEGDNIVSLRGCIENGKSTTLHGNITVRTNHGRFTELQNIHCSGEGVGLTANSPVFLYGSSFTGYETAVDLLNGFLTTQYGQYRDNGVAIRFRSDYTDYADSNCEKNTFEDNGTALLLENSPLPEPIQFTACSFLHNGTDIDNLGNVAIDTTDSTFEP